MQNNKPENNVVVTPEDFTLEEEKIKLTRIEKKKYKVIMQVINGEINGTQAANKLGITTRQVRNLKRQVLDEGKKGVIHKNKNYKPYNTYDSDVSTQVCRLYRREYKGMNFSKFARICQEEYGIEASRSTIYNFLRKSRIRSPQRKAKKKKVISYDEQGNKIIQMVRVYDRKTTNNPTGKKIVASTKVVPAKKTKKDDTTK